MAQRSELKARNDLLARQIDRQNEHYAALTAQYENLRRIRHDISSHLYTMQLLLQEGQYDEAAAYSAEVTEACVLSAVPSATYAYYFEHIKPKPQPAAEKKTGFVCKICGYVYEGETLPADYICPLCKHGAEDFEPLK